MHLGLNLKILDGASHDGDSKKWRFLQKNGWKWQVFKFQKKYTHNIFQHLEKDTNIDLEFSAFRILLGKELTSTFCGLLCFYFSKQSFKSFWRWETSKILGAVAKFGISWFAKYENECLPAKKVSFFASSEILAGKKWPYENSWLLSTTKYASISTKMGGSY